MREVSLKHFLAIAGSVYTFCRRERAMSAGLIPWFSDNLVNENTVLRNEVNF